MIDTKKLPKPVLSKSGNGKSARIDNAIYVTKDGFVNLTQKGGIDYPCGTDRDVAVRAFNAMLDEAQKVAR